MCTVVYNAYVYNALVSLLIYDYLNFSRENLLLSLDLTSWVPRCAHQHVLGICLAL